MGAEAPEAEAGAAEVAEPERAAEVAQEQAQEAEGAEEQAQEAEERAQGAEAAADGRRRGRRQGDRRRRGRRSCGRRRAQGRGRRIEVTPVLGQRVVDVARSLVSVHAVAAPPGDVDDRLLAESLQAHLADDPRIHDRGSNGARARAALVSARARGSARGRGAEEEVAHRAAAARGARDLGENRQPDRQPEAQHERQRDRERCEPRPRYEHGARRRQPARPIRGCSPQFVTHKPQFRSRT